MASIVQRNKSYSVVYTIYDGEKKRQKWETYHSYVLNGKDILHQFPAAFDEGRTVTVLKRPKTQSSIQTVYLPDYVLDVLRDWKETLKPVKRKQPDLILRYSNGRPLSEETLPRLLEKQLLQLGLPVVSFHSLRHYS